MSPQYEDTALFPPLSVWHLSLWTTRKIWFLMTAGGGLSQVAVMAKGFPRRRMLFGIVLDATPHLPPPAMGVLLRSNFVC